MLVMLAILRKFGILSREIAIYSKYNNNDGDGIVHSHALLEVWNDEDKRWELHDIIGDYAYAIETVNGIKPASVMDVFTSPPELISFMPGNADFIWTTGKYVVERNEFRQNNFDFYLRNGFFNTITVNYLSYHPYAMINLAKVDMEYRFSEYGNRNIVENLNCFLCFGRSNPVIYGYFFGRNGTKIIEMPPLREGFEFQEFFPELAAEIEVELAAEIKEAD